MSSVSGGVTGVEPDSVNIDLGSVSINLDIERVNFNYLEFIKEFF